MTLAWNRSPGTNIAGYKVYYGVASRIYTNAISVGNVTNAAVTGLPVGATYFFAVTSYTTSGLESDFSTESSYTISPAGSSPSVVLTSPANGASYASPASISLAASVTANGHTITKVQFYNAATLLGEAATPPYSYAWNNVGAGAYALSARAVYDTGSVASSASNNVTVSTVPNSPAPAGLVAAYSFDEGAGSTVVDASGKGNSGTISGASWTIYGHFGKALAFDGTTSAVVINDSASLDLTNKMTLEAWVYPVTLGAWRDVVYKGDDLYFLEAATPVSGPSAGIGNSYTNGVLSGPSALPTGAWSHLAATYDGATLRLYVNGVQVASRAWTSPIAVSSLPLSIGADTLHGSHFSGVIDEVRIYNRALSASEIQTDLNTPITQAVSNPPPGVVLTSPANGASYASPVNINLAASVTANGHSITKVQFYNGASLLGEASAAPYSFAWNGVGAGSYSLSARLVYDAGITLDSTAVNVLVAANRPRQPLPSILTLPATSGTITGPFVALNGTILQTLATGLTNGGRAAYSFTVPTASNYVVQASVNAPTTTNNSFYVNIDAEPTDPTMIWDIPVTTGFTNRFVSWRGNGTPDANQFVPKVFALSAGTHQLIVRGREANTQLGAVTIEPLTAVAPTLQITIKPNKQVVLTGTGLPNNPYQVLCSTDLTTWVVIGSVTTDTSGAFQFVDPANATKARCVYRVSNFLAPTLQITVKPNKQVVLTGTGLPNHSYQVLCSTNLTTWVVIGSVTTDAIGTFQFADPANATKSRCVYRLQG